MNKFFASLSLLLLTIAFSPAHAEIYRQADVERLLQKNEAPDGVVFELLSWDQKTWQWAAPMIRDLRAQLQRKFPQLDVAMVSHGGEQFQLTRENASKQPQAIAQLQSLSEDGVALHVCGTHSSWKDVPDSAYIDIVDVSPSGPAQINDYIKLGYQHILLQKPDRD